MSKKIKNLIMLADSLDKEGKFADADYIDNLIHSFAAKSPPKKI